MGFLRLRPPAGCRPPANGKRPQARTNTNRHERTRGKRPGIRAKLSTRTRAFTPCPAAPPSHSPSVPDTPVPPPHLRGSPAPQPPPAQPAALSTSPLLHCGTTSPPLLAPTGTVPSLICALSTSASNASVSCDRFGTHTRFSSFQIAQAKAKIALVRKYKAATKNSFVPSLKLLLRASRSLPLS
ncbi:hypothetical protein SAMN02787142_1993 [Burkholderia sp. WP9]|nr:hypothetical protein SAMN02787142_1993 [Burkholderia sp. WP9]